MKYTRNAVGLLLFPIGLVLMTLTLVGAAAEEIQNAIVEVMNTYLGDGK